MKTYKTIFKQTIIILILIVFPLSLQAQQIIPERIKDMPDKPEPYKIRNWEEVAHHYDSLVFDTSLTGEYLPLMTIHNQGVNYDHSRAGMASYVGQNPGSQAEAINYIPAVVGASLAGIDKSEQFGQNWVLMAADFFNRANGEDVYLNNYSGSSGNDWWYETMPNVFFYQLNDLYPHTGDFHNQFITVADRWLEAVKAMGASATPWQIPNMNYRAWNLKKMEPLESGVKQPAASGAIAYILYHAFVETGNQEYLTGAEWALEFLNSQTSNPAYELQFAYGTYVAARMNAEQGTNYQLNKMVDWCFNQGHLRGWGIITGNWGGYDCSGLRGEAFDNGNDYAFLMNGIQQAAALVPMVRYQEQYANAVAKWLLNLANASKYFYPGFLPAENQDNETWGLENAVDSCIAHESMRETKNGKSPVATGDAVDGGWAPTNLSLYSSSHIGYLGSMVEKTNVNGILKININKTDFYSRAYPSFLVRNPYQQDTAIAVNTGDTLTTIYDALQNQVIIENASGSVPVNIPAGKARILVYIPSDASMHQQGQKTYVNNNCIDYNNGVAIADHPPRIKALEPLKHAVTKGDSIFLYCTAEDTENHQLNYQWSMNGEPVEGDSVFKGKAPDNETELNFRCVVSANEKTDTATRVIEVKEKIPHIPEIESIEASPRKLAPGANTTLTCYAKENNGDSLSYNWRAPNGELNGSGEEITWAAPEITGNYTIACTVSDIDGATTDSIDIMVRNINDLERGKPVLLLPFNGNAKDYSGFNQQTHASGISFTKDSFGNTEAAAHFNGTSAYVSVENAPSLNFSNGLTVAGWMYAREQNDNETYLISHGSWDNRWKVSFQPPYLRSTINTEEGITDLDTYSPLEPETWYHWAAIYTGADMEIYINGKLNAFKSFTGKLNPSSFDLTIGKARPDQAYFFHGRIDEIALFDHALPPEAVKNIYQNGITGINQTNNKAFEAKVYPNPANQFVKVELNTRPTHVLYYALNTITGKTIKTGQWNSSKKTTLKLNTGTLPEGLYMLKLQTRTSVHVQKIIIRHP